MSEEPENGTLDVSDMYAVHGVFRDTLGEAPALVARIAPGDTLPRTALIANYYENILWFLEAHHDGEEKLVFPLLRERCAGEDALLARMEEQHDDALALLEDAQHDLAAWQPGDAATRQAVTASLEALRVGLVSHLDEEEENVLPLAAVNLSPEEWGALPGHAMGNFQGDKIWLILGLIRERFNDEQRAQMLAHMPPPAVEMWTSFGEQAFKELSTEVADGS